MSTQTEYTNFDEPRVPSPEEVDRIVAEAYEARAEHVRQGIVSFVNGTRRWFANIGRQVSTDDRAAA